MRWVGIVGLLLGCGRVGFDVAAATNDAATDADLDVDGPAAELGFVQASFACLDLVTSVPVALDGAQAAASLNVVVIGVNDLTSNITSITDLAGNAYLEAVPLDASGMLRQTMYIAVPIAASPANVVTVTFDQPATLVGVMVAEYRGIDPSNPIITTASAGGTGTTSDSGTATVSEPALLVGANTNGLAGTAGPGPGYTQRLFTDYQDILEDRIVTTGGVYRADAPLTTNHQWVMQMLALRPQ